ncbi:MAG: class I SAM-dependent methyltransferase [Planctomycetota bacterium]|jgi:outer membrane protein assembly factor BamB
MRRASLVLALVASAGAAGGADLAGTVRSSGVKGGLVVHLGCGDGRDTARLRLDDRYLVQGLDTSEANVREARRRILETGLYGKVSVRRFDGRGLPYVDNLVNVIVSDRTNVPRQEIMRVLAPLGVAVIGGRKTVKPWPEDIDEWTHYLHGADNNAVAADRVAAQPRSLQWVSHPRWGRSHEELASMSAAVTSKGRVFYIVDEAPLASIRFLGQWKLVARDAFNGTLLWKRDVPQWNDHLRHFRSGPVHLQRRLVSVGDRVYATLGLAAPVVALDAATGETLTTFRGSEHTEEILVEDGKVFVVVGTSEAKRKGGGLHGRGEPKPTSFRYIAAYQADTGRQLWKHVAPNGEFILPLTLTAKGGSVFYQSTFGVVRLDARSGEALWRTERLTPAKRMGFTAPTVVATDEVLLVADRDASEKDAARGGLEWGVHGWNEGGFARKGKCTLRAYSVKTGKEIWSVGASEQYNAPVDVFVTGDTVWVGVDFKEYDLKTGKLKRPLKWKGARVAMPHHRCYRNKATERFILTGRSGIEVVDYEKGWIGNNSWIRGTCQYGIMPANGLVYAPPDACGCYLKVKVQGFFAAAPRRGKDGRMPFSGKPQLEKGPAYTDAGGTDADAESWPMYRHDATRSGAASTSLPGALRRKWSAKLGGRLTQATVSGGRAYVAVTDAHTLHALDVDGGREVWRYTAGGRIDSAPAVHRGRVIFGSADGHVYCLRASDGELAWRFRAAPNERQAGVYDQLESVWPVHGAVLIQDGSVYAAAGRTSYLDGGILLYRIDPMTGKELARSVVHHIDPDSEKQTGAESGGFDMVGVGVDVLSGDGESIYMKHFRFDADCKQMKEVKPHLFAITGLLGEEWFVRSYWVHGTATKAGWGGWAWAASQAPAGRILSLTDDRVYGYGRVRVQSGAVGHRADAYHLFCRERKAPPAPAPAPKVKGKKRRSGGGSQLSAPVWSDGKSIVARAMVLADDRLAIAGPPDLGRKNPKLLAFENEPEALSGFSGEKGVFLRIVSAADGKKLWEQRLSAMPVLDGLSAAEGRLFISLRDGTVECWGR